MLFDFLLENWTLVLAILIVIGLLVFENALPSSGKAVDVNDVAQILNHQQGVVLDIREKDSFAKGHIANAKNIPFTDLESKITQIQKWQKKPIIVACDTSVISRKAIKILKTKGFENLYLLTGGMGAWHKQSFPVVKKEKSAK